MKVLVAMSGGVDSSVAASLLVEEGHSVVGLFLRGAGAAEPNPAGRGCCSAGDAADAARVADLLGIPFYAADFAAEFEGLVDAFVAEYLRGRTPNPCIACNRDLKFGRALEYASALGCDAIATGHYARVEGRNGRMALRRAADSAKDQSYVLFPLAQEVLRRVRFPIGGLEKGRVRELARERGLPTADKRESQDICFVPGGDYREVVRRRATPGVRALSPGRFVGAGGETLGRHDGTAGFTVGQRRGLGLSGAAHPLYVTAIDAASGTVTVGGEEGLRRREVLVGGWNGVAAPSPGAGETLRGRGRLRHGHRPQPAVATGGADGTVAVRFEEGVLAPAPGQALVLYDGEDRVLGGGWIEAVLDG